ncbi:MAG: hypothetical protein ABI416_08270, partial [Ginsengibacter sp.]
LNRTLSLCESGSITLVPPKTLLFIICIKGIYSYGKSIVTKKNRKREPVKILLKDDCNPGNLFSKDSIATWIE